MMLRQEPNVALGLDHSAVATVLGERLGVPLSADAIRVERCWPDGDGRLRYEWRVRVGPGEELCVFGVPPREKSATHFAVQRCPGALRLCAPWPAAGLLLHTSDRDPRLPHLAGCLDASAMAARLSPLVAGDGAIRVVATLLAHKPGRRAAIRYDLHCGERRVARFAGKTFRDGRGIAMCDRHARVNCAFADAGLALRVPAPLAYHDDLRLVLMEWVDGRTSQTGALLPTAALTRAVDLLSAFHRIELSGLSPFTPRDELAIARRWVAALRVAQPEAASDGEALLASLTDFAASLDDVEPCVIHRDFYEKQLVWRRGTTVLLDLDTLALGDPALDLGNLIGHLHLHHAEAGRPTGELPAVGRRLLRRYQRGNPRISERNVRFYWVSSLLRGGAIHRLRDATRRHADGMWEAASRLLDERRTARRRRGSAAAEVTA